MLQIDASGDRVRASLERVAHDVRELRVRCAEDVQLQAGKDVGQLTGLDAVLEVFGDTPAQVVPEQAVLRRPATHPVERRELVDRPRVRDPLRRQ